MANFRGGPGKPSGGGAVGGNGGGGDGGGGDGGGGSGNGGDGGGGEGGGGAKGGGGDGGGGGGGDIAELTTRSALHSDAPRPLTARARKMYVVPSFRWLSVYVRLPRSIRITTFNSWPNCIS